MTTSFVGLLAGLALAIVLVYLLIVVNFQSWLDPFIIISALPAALAGIVWMLFLSHTTFSVPALTGAIMCMGVATANSILVVSFAKDELARGRAARSTRRSTPGSRASGPVLMTALAMIIGMVPMALGLRRGRRAERAARPRGHRRPDAGDGRDAVLRPGGVCAAARPHGRAHATRCRIDRRRMLDDRGSVCGPLIVGGVLLLAALPALRSGASRRAPSALDRGDAAKRASWRCRPSSVIAARARRAAAGDRRCPGTMQAFTDAAIYARTQRLPEQAVRRHRRRACSAGQVLAEIDTPEIDQQLAQARADLATAEANARLAQTTAERYRDLIKTDSVSQQDLDNANGSLEAQGDRGARRRRPTSGGSSSCRRSARSTRRSTA